MNWTQLELLMDAPPSSSSGRTCPESSAPKTTHSVASSLDWLAKVKHWCPSLHPLLESQAAGGAGTRKAVSTHSVGQSLVVSLDPAEQSHGGSLMPNISEWPNDAVVCSLSQVLETGLIPQRFFLSPTACAGILHRAETWGKKLPDALHHALTAAASQEPTKPAVDTCSQSPGPGTIQNTLCGECGERFWSEDKIHAMAPAECPRCGEENKLSAITR
jgi:hypothetical protein